MIALIVVIAVVVLLGLWGVGVYNNLVRLRNNRENARSEERRVGKEC